MPEADLPVVLPEVETYQPSGTGESPLATIEDWLYAEVDGQPVKRETNTMPQWAGSCWYYLRFIDPQNSEALVDPEKEQYWMPVDLYVGGAEHAVLHLLYARFWHKVLFDAGVVSTPEPFGRLVNQGMILGEVEYTGYRRVDTGELVSGDELLLGVGHGRSVLGSSAESDDLIMVEHVSLAEDQVVKKDDKWFWREHPEVPIRAGANKMSKSRGNVVNPDDVIAEYGADSLRLYEMFMGPLEQTKPWSTRDVGGVHRFLARAYRLVIDSETNERSARVEQRESTKDELRDLHAAIKKVTEDIEGLRFNTAIAAMMEYVNSATKRDTIAQSDAETFTLLLAPFAPHLAEELWTQLGHTESLTYAAWPQHDESLLVEDTITLAVQVNGKVRGTIDVAAEADKATVLEAAKAEENVARYLEGKTLRREIVVPGRLVNLVVG